MIISTKNGRKATKKVKKAPFLSLKKGNLTGSKNDVLARYKRLNMQFAI